ncbi:MULTISPECIES: hypothetical protein [Photorhabdus]|uniref:Uncharacterized protein n=1 Tax=Photorhabdus hindustanensis TaxID=2918802 RepID=A0A2S8PW77_9GAMM|nr:MULTISPECIES: hypothetical protein [Photorhabdus]MCC8457055.1 hypothetical protein [Photorhabdus aegyptia]PQQ23160.1 hypothetical protein C6H66_20380 [Photorhabdus hindustanensis]
MSWPIPEIPELKAVEPLRYWLWFIILLLILVIGTFVYAFLKNTTDFVHAAIYSSFPSFLIWLMLFGVVLNRYEQYCMAAYAWEDASAETRFQWQQWSRKQLAVVGNIILTPEPQGMASLLGDAKDIPVFPHKGRPLFSPTRDIQQLLDKIDQDLEKQCPGYRYFLRKVYIAESPAIDLRLYASRDFIQYQGLISRKWKVRMEHIENRDEIDKLYDKETFDELVMVIAFQLWPTKYDREAYSEFVSVQLFSSVKFASEKKLNILANMGRALPSLPGEITKDLPILFEYNRIDKSSMRDLWVTGVTNNVLTELAMYSHEHSLNFSWENPIHLIDHTFGPPGPLSVFLTPAMLTEVVRLTNSDHIVINQLPEGNALLYLMTKELHK